MPGTNAVHAECEPDESYTICSALALLMDFYVYYAEELDPEQRALIEEHLPTCGRCQIAEELSIKYYLSVNDCFPAEEERKKRIQDRRRLM